MSAFFRRSIVAIQLSRRSASFHALAMTAALLMVMVSTAQANSIVYSLTSIPNSNSVVYADNLNPLLTDTLSGTITVSSTQDIFGTWNSTNVPSPAITLIYDLSMSNSSVSDDNIVGSQDLATLINNHDIQGGGLTITSSGIFMPNPNVSGGQVFFEDDGGTFPTTPYPVVSLTWNGNLSAFAKLNNFNSADLQILAEPSTTPPVSSIYGSGATWQIAAVVPEPATFVLGVAGMAGLGLVSLRRKRGSTPAMPPSIVGS